MKELFLCLLFLSVLFTTSFAQANDSQQLQPPDSSIAAYESDSALLQLAVKLSNHQSAFFSTTDKQVVYDVQQTVKPKSNAIVFAVLVLLLIMIAYLKAAFGKDLEELLQSFANRNIALQFFRTQQSELSFSSLLLHINFILVMSLYVRFFLMWYMQVTSLENISAILFLIFLFTFFYLAKIVAVKLLGIVFEVKDVSDEYIYYFSIACKTVGLALIPALFIFYAAPPKFFNFIFLVSNFVLLVFAIMFIMRGLSTGYKLMYRSVYHFFIYVCVVEISPIFLLLKLLTKTVV
ncbi:MAG: DUF4271 domain-containing protein [Chitinophagales bacterium]|nr:DUF4271 domain-containing protein [Chitinophagales bacterium]